MSTTCGDYGGRNTNGEPCGRTVEEGKCWQHKSQGGRPPYVPTEQDRELVKRCIMGGIPQEQIADVLDITAKTLRKHFREEIDKAYLKANAKVVGTAFQQATSGKNPAMTMFWLKTRMGWKETQKLEHSGEVDVNIDDVREDIQRKLSS